VRGSARFLVAIVAAQIGLGLTTYVVKFGFLTWVADRWRFAAAYIVPEKTFWQVNLITMHAATGSLILATATYHLLRACRAKANAAGADVAKVAA
jgi:cytochrome c oxidase assembly protein subunit 15